MLFADEALDGKVAIVIRVNSLIAMSSMVTVQMRLVLDRWMDGWTEGWSFRIKFQYFQLNFFV